jgi:hypothetical protein
VNLDPFLVFCRYLRSLYPSGMRIGLVLDPQGPTSRPVGSGQQRRAGLHPDQRQLPEPDRGPLRRVRYFTLGHARHPDVTAVGVAGQEPEQAVTLLRHGGLLLAGERDQVADGQGGGLTIAADPPGAVDEAVDQ